MISPLNNYPEGELLALMREGRKDAFIEIYERYWLRLYIAAVKRLKSRDDAKDIVQDLFFSFWMKRETVVINTSLCSYLFAAIKYKVINYMESNIVKSSYRNSRNAALTDYGNFIHQQISKSDLEVFIDLKVAHLSPKVKEVSELSTKENHSISEIAEKLHTSNRTVKNKLGKVLKTFKVHLANASILPF